MKITLMTIAIIFISAFTGLYSISAEKREIRNLEAFTRLYGYVRYFHPSDEGQTINWDKFAVYGAGQVRKAKDDAELKQTLYELFLPVAPTLQLYDKGKQPQDNLAAITPSNPDEWQTTCWQHTGLSDIPQTKYVNRRTNRLFNITADTTACNPKGHFAFEFPYYEPTVTEYRLSFSFKPVITDTSNTYLNIYTNSDGFIDSLFTTGWQRKTYSYECDLKLLESFFYIEWNGFKEALIDSILVEAKQKGVWTPIYFNDFSNDREGDIPDGLNIDCYYGKGDRFSYNTVTVVNENGHKVLKLHSSSTGSGTKKGYYARIYPETLPFGTFLNKELVSSIWCKLPMTLYCNKTGTYPPAEATRIKYLHQQIDTLNIQNGDDKDTQLAALLIFWNSMQHFYPYWRYLDIDWHKSFRSSMRETLNGRRKVEFETVLLKMMSMLKDGHTYVSESSSRFLMPGFWVDYKSDKWIVTHVYRPGTDIPVGSEVLQINGSSFRKYLEKYRPLYSYATKQFTSSRLYWNSMSAYQDTVATFTFRTPGRKVIKRTCNMLPEPIKTKIDFTFPREESSIVYSDSIFYLNIHTGKIGEVEYRALLPRLAKAKGIIIDWRKKPRTLGFGLLTNLLACVDTLTAPGLSRYLYPDHQSVITKRSSSGSWNLKPALPHINAKVVFLCSSSNVSYEESYLWYVKHYKLATLMGETTAGTSGDIARLSMPGGFQIYYTGMFCENPDGSRFHGVGINPDIVVKPTVKGIIDGKDEQLDAALEFMQKELKLSELPKPVSP